MVISELIAFIGCGSAYSHVEVERGGKGREEEEL